MKDFVHDDHEHSFSVTNLSVQLYTMPTLAHFLIRREDALAILLRTFISELRQFKDPESHKLNLQKKLPDHPR